MRVAFGRVEMPWAVWDMQGAEAPHVKHSAEMARRLKEIGMPVIVSCWFPPSWAGDQTTRSDGTARAFHLKSTEQQRIFASLASYLEFLKKDYGVEADYFSFNESDLGIDVVFTPQEHCDFIKAFGQYLADRGIEDAPAARRQFRCHHLRLYPTGTPRSDSTQVYWCHLFPLMAWM